MHTVTVRQKRGYANTRDKAGHTCLSLGHVLVLKKVCSWNPRESLLRKKAERLRLNVKDEKATRKMSVLTLRRETETMSAGRHAFIVKSLSCDAGKVLTA